MCVCACLSERRACVCVCVQDQCQRDAEFTESGRPTHTCWRRSGIERSKQKQNMQINDFPPPPNTPTLAGVYQMSLKDRTRLRNKQREIKRRRLTLVLLRQCDMCAKLTLVCSVSNFLFWLTEDT